MRAMRGITVDEGRIYAEETGAGPAVLLLHAGVADRRVWDLVAPSLAAAGYRVIRYDMRGFGRSAPATGPHSLIDDAHAVLTAAGEETAHFVGLSQGAATSVDTALAHPGRVRSLTLVAPGLTGYPWPRLPGFARRMAAAEAGDAHGLAVEIARLWAPLSFVDASAPNMAAPRTTAPHTGAPHTTAPHTAPPHTAPPHTTAPHTAPPHTATAGQNQPGAAAPAVGHPRDIAAQIIVDQAEAFMRDELEIEEPSAVERLGEITAPTLVVLGAADVAPVSEIGALLAGGIPGARRVTISGADHMLPLRVPERLVELLVPHLASAEAAVTTRRT